MAFGLKYIQGAEDDKTRALKKELQEQSDEGIAGDTQSRSPAPSPQAGQRFNRRPAPQTVKTEVSDANQSRPVTNSVSNTQAASPSNIQQADKQTPAATNSFIKAKAIFENDGDVTPEMYNELPSSEFDEDEKEEVAVAEEEHYGPTKQQKLSLRARRLAQEVGEFKKWSLDQILVLERRAQREPEIVIDELLPIYRNEVQPTRQMGFRSLDDAVKKHADDTVFLLVKGDKDKVRVIPRGTGQDVLNGAVLESLQANSTPFDKPKYVLPKLFEKEEQSSPAQKSPSP